MNLLMTLLLLSYDWINKQQHKPTKIQLKYLQENKNFDHTNKVLVNSKGFK